MHIPSTLHACSLRSSLHIPCCSTHIPGTFHAKFMPMPYLLHTHSMHIPYKKQCQNSTKKTSKIRSKILKNTCKIHLKWVPNPSLGTSWEPFCKKCCFYTYFSSQWRSNGSPEGAQKSLKITKTRKKRVLKKHLKSVPQKTSKICDFGTPQNLPDRAETRARASFSLIHPITKTSSKFTKKAPILEPLGPPKSQKMPKSDLQKNTLKMSAQKYQKIAKKKPVLAWEREARFKLQNLRTMTPCIFHPHSIHVPFPVPCTFPDVPHIFLA